MKCLLACNANLYYFNFLIDLKETKRKNKQNREKEKDLHTCGRHGYQRVEDDMVSTFDPLY